MVVRAEYLGDGCRLVKPQKKQKNMNAVQIINNFLSG
jgi:hypothetical protein